MATPYVKQTWIDGDPTKPFSAARLAVMESGIFDAHYKPAVSVYASAPIVLADTATTVITFDTELYDTDNMHSTVTNTGRLVAPIGGKYHISGRGSFAANAAGTRDLLLRINGTTNIDEDTDPSPTAGTGSSLQCNRDYLLAAGDFLELIATQNTGGNLATGSGRALMHFQMHLVSY